MPLDAARCCSMPLDAARCRSMPLDPGVVGVVGVTSSASVPLSCQHETLRHSIVFAQLREPALTTPCVILPRGPLASRQPSLRASASGKAICVHPSGPASFRVSPFGA
jgi:hypothetical protein